jgi:hypothetical protein
MLLGPQPEPLVAEIIATLRMRYKRLNPHYEAGWTDSWSHRRCMHQHHTLIDAANCAQQNDTGWYVIAVEGNTPRELSVAEEEAALDAELEALVSPILSSEVHVYRAEFYITVRTCNFAT